MLVEFKKKLFKGYLFGVMAFNEEVKELSLLS
jgi:hypothetical protein